MNLEKYPIQSMGESQLQSYIDTFCSKGLCVLENFIRPDILPEVVKQVSALAPKAFHNEVCGNAYLDVIDENLPENHVRCMVETTKLGAIAYDQIPEDCLIRQVYEWSPVIEFVQKVVNCGKLYHYDCPLGALNLTVMKDSEYLRWHFDQSDFVVSIPLQQAHEGGVFEYVHNLRSDDKENYEDVKKVLQGDRSRVQVQIDQPGALVLFRGMNTLHRVTPIKGEKPRLGALLSYVDQQGLRSSDYLKQIRYGRTT